jgi:protoporphyrinogen oxidase
MWETVAKKIIGLGGEIHYSTKIEHITALSSSAIKSATCINIKTENRFELSGDYFFSTIPVNELVLNMQGVVLDPLIEKVAKGLVYRDFIITGILLKKLHVNQQQNQNQVNDNWIYLQDKGIMAGRVQFFNNWSPFMVKDSDTTWIGVEYFCNDDDAFWNQDDAGISKIAIEEMEKIGLINIEDVIDTTVIKVSKAYPSYTGTYNNFELLQNYLDRFENLFPIGRNGMHRYNNSDHSMMTAMVAVENIINGIKDKSNIWAVNLEEDYHEEN